MRAYSTAVVATALGVSRKWLDQVAAADRIPGVQPHRQGKSRAIAPRAIITIAVAAELAERIGASLPVALDLATTLVQQGTHRLTAEMSIQLDVGAVERRVTLRLGDAVESNPTARRGRPPRRVR